MAILFRIRRESEDGGAPIVCCCGSTRFTFPFHDDATVFACVACGYNYCDWERREALSPGTPWQDDTVLTHALPMLRRGEVLPLILLKELQQSVEMAVALRRRRRDTHLRSRGLNESVMERDGRRCVLCRKRSNLTIDHIIPLARGGGSEIENLRVLCRRCNSAKGTTYPEATND